MTTPSRWTGGAGGPRRRHRLRSDDGARAEGARSRWEPHLVGANFAVEADELRAAAGEVTLVCDYGDTATPYIGASEPATTTTTDPNAVRSCAPHVIVGDVGEAPSVRHPASGAGQPGARRRSRREAMASAPSTVTGPARPDAGQRQQGLMHVSATATRLGFGRAGVAQHRWWGGQMRMRRQAAVVLMGVVVVAGCGGEDDPGTATERPATTIAGDLQLGERVFARNCASCHGRGGDGGMGPKLADGRVVERYPDPRDHREVVVEGRGAMPAWGDRLTDEEIDAVVRYEREGL